MDMRSSIVSLILFKVLENSYLIMLHLEKTYIFKMWCLPNCLVAYHPNLFQSLVTSKIEFGGNVDTTLFLDIKKWIYNEVIGSVEFAHMGFKSLTESVYAALTLNSKVANHLASWPSMLYKYRHTH